MSLTPKFWHKYFRVYDILNEVKPYQDLLAEITKQVEPKKGDKILDAGSGTGNLAILLCKSGANVVALDFAEVGLARHKAKDSTAVTVLGDLTKPLPFPDAHFDAVVSNNTIYSIETGKRLEVFAEFYRVIKPGGRIVIANIVKNWRPTAIYKAHWHHLRQNHSLANVISKAMKLLPETLLMFYYNALINLHYGANNFITGNEQELLCKNAGFVNIKIKTDLYAGQSVLHSAQKL